MTIKDCLNRAADESPAAIALKYRRGGAWRTRTFSELRERAWHVSEMLAHLGVQAGDRVAIFHENSPEWYELYHGIVGIGAIAVPVDARFREMETVHIFHDCGISAAFCSARSANMFADLKGKLHDLRAVIVLGSRDGGLPDGQWSYEGLRKELADPAMSSERAFDQLDPAADSPASFIYTSGTTGRPKGAVLSHRNFVSNVQSIAEGIDVRKTDNFMLVLPLHHSFAFTTMFLLPVYMQCRVSLVESLKTIRPNMAECAPTVLIAVPLLLEKMLARIQNGINERKLARWMCRCGLAKVVGHKIHQGLGGALRLIVSGGAPISPATLLGWQKLGFRIVEGYGVTETAPVLTLNPMDAPKVGTVGLPLSGVEIGIFEPDADGVGEIIARGPNVMQGYYNNPEETQKALRDGWYHTGDLGYVDADGHIVINGRKKSLIVNREGKNIYPEEVELQVLKSDWVLECLVVGYREPGEDAGERVGLLVVPDPERIAAEEDQTGRHLSDRKIEELVREEIRRQVAGLSSYKQPRKIQIRFEEFEKTTTQKIKRYLYAIDTSR